MVTHASTLELRRLELRRRPENTLLVIGDERAMRLARIARGHRGWAFSTVDNLQELDWAGPWGEVLVDAEFLDRVRQLHPEVLRTARRVWVAPRPDQETGGGGDPFTYPLPVAGRCLKRALDIVLAMVGLLLLLPVLVAALVAVRLDSPGPSIFKQVRVGVNGRRFRLYKLRTMRHHNEDRSHREYVARLIAGTGERCEGIYKLTDDPRVTRVGRFLRHYSVDEIPQLWNVLKGDMSLVGPRPPLPHETELYPADAWARLRVKPGITGLWQVSGRCEVSFHEMVSLDIRYWRHWTFLQDLVILLKTPKTVISGRGAA